MDKGEKTFSNTSGESVAVNPEIRTYAEQMKADNIKECDEVKAQ